MAKESWEMKWRTQARSGAHACIGRWMDRTRKCASGSVFADEDLGSLQTLLEERYKSDAGALQYGLHFRVRGGCRAWTPFFYLSVPPLHPLDIIEFYSFFVFGFFRSGGSGWVLRSS